MLQFMLHVQSITFAGNFLTSDFTYDEIGCVNTLSSEGQSITKLLTTFDVTILSTIIYII